MAVVFDKVFKFRCDDSIIKYISQLAEASERTPSQFMRDLIFWMRMAQGGELICANLKDQRIRYRPFKAAATLPEMKKPVVPWRQPGDE